MRAETSLSATACGSCLAISIKLNNFFTPMLNTGDFPSSRPNPAFWSMATASLVSWASRNSSTSVRTCSREAIFEIGGTRSSESKFSENPRSVRIEWEEEVAMMRRRRPWRVGLVNGYQQQSHSYLRWSATKQNQKGLKNRVGEPGPDWRPIWECLGI